MKGKKKAVLRAEKENVKNQSELKFDIEITLK